MSAVYDHRSYSENINARPMATSLRVMAETISYYTTLLEAFKANQSTVALLLSATQNIVNAAEQITPRESLSAESGVALSKTAAAVQ